MGIWGFDLARHRSPRGIRPIRTREDQVFENSEPLSSAELGDQRVEFLPARTVMSTFPWGGGWNPIVINGGGGGDGGGTGGGQGGGTGGDGGNGGTGGNGGHGGPGGPGIGGNGFGGGGIGGHGDHIVV